MLLSKKNIRSYAHNQASSFGLGNKKTTTGIVSTFPFLVTFICGK